MLIAQIENLTLNARELTRLMCFDLSRDARAAIACRSRVARVLCVFRLRRICDIGLHTILEAVYTIVFLNMLRDTVIGGGCFADIS